MITAEAFSEERIDDQAIDLRHLVRQERSWLEVQCSWVYERFSHVDVAVRSIHRSLEQPRRQELILREDGIACGIGRVVKNQMVGNPSRWSQTMTRKLRGDRIEYWTSEDVAVADHCQATRLLIAETATDEVLAVLNSAEKERAVGIPLIMDSVGSPVQHVYVPSSVHAFGLHWKKGPLQVYRYDKAEHKPHEVSS